MLVFLLVISIDLFLSQSLSPSNHEGTCESLPLQKPSERDCSVSKRTPTTTNTPPRKVNWNILDAEKLILEANLHTERKRQLHIIRRIIIRQALCVGIKHKLDVLLPRTITSRNLDGVTHQLYNLTPLCLYYARTAFHRE